MPDWEKALNAKSIEAYSDFIKKHPCSPFAEQAKKRIVDIEVSDIMSGDHGTLPSPSKISSGDGRTYSVTNIHNDTKYNLTIRYSGPDSFSVTFKPEEKGSLEMLRGKYKIAASVDATNVKNYAGEETSDGGNYEVVYYIVSQFSPERISMPSFYYGNAPEFKPWPSKRLVPEYLK
jgi:hypothetical protein